MTISSGAQVQSPDQIFSPPTGRRRSPATMSCSMHRAPSGRTGIRFSPGSVAFPMREREIARRTPRSARPRNWHRLRHLRRPERSSATLDARSRSPRHLARGNGKGWRRRSSSAPGCFDALLNDIYGAQHLLRAGACAGRARLFRQRLSEALQRHSARSRRLDVLRGRPRARRRRQVARHRQPHRDLGRYRLRTGQPRRPHPCRRRPLQGLQRAALGRLFPGSADHADAPLRPRECAHRLADPWAASRGLFLALLSRPLPRLSDRRGPRSQDQRAARSI